MTDPQWKRVLELYESTWALSPEAADALLDSSGEDPETVKHVLSMLESDHQAGGASAPDEQPDPGAYAGATIGRYDVLTRIGRGSSGEVYSGRDRELGRPVALKFLSAEYAGAGSAVKRFIREAQAASALNHPNIVTIHEVITWKSLPVIVMELVEGAALRTLCGQPMPVERVIAIGSQIAQALAFAHANSIVHRDLKPENLMIRPDGYVKVLDLGLARRTAPDAAVTNQFSSVGMAVGTLNYMSPEQCRGEPATAASDVFSLGTVLYELASGIHPFDKGSLLQTLEALNYFEPPAPSSLNPSVPPNLDALILQTLAKDASQRPPAAEIARALELPGIPAALRALGDATVPPTQAPVPRGRQSSMEEKFARASAPLIPSPRPLATGPLAQRPLLSTLVILAVAGLALVSFYLLRSPQPAAPETRLDIVVPATDDRSSIALSPDGRSIAFAAFDNGVRRLWVRPLDFTSAHPLPGTEGATSPFWSPDGQSLGFFADYKLKRIDLGRSQPQVLAPAPSSFPQGTWGINGIILFTPSGLTPLSRVAASGGPITPALKLQHPHVNQLAPRFLPGGRQFFFVVNGSDPGIWLGSLDGAPPRRIAPVIVGTDSVPEYLPSGWLVRVHQSVLEAQRFDPSRGQLSGDPQILDRSVVTDALTLAGSFSASASGAIAWRSGAGRRSQLIWFNRSGQNLGLCGEPGDSTLFSPEISPDGQRVATMRGPIGSSDIWVLEGVRNTRFTLDPADDRYATWSPDGTRLAFASNRHGNYDLYEKAADGSGPEQLMLQSPEFKRPNSWSPDGRFLLFWAAQNNGDLMVLPLSGDRKPFPFVNTPYDEQQGVFSPDGKWVAYQSDQSGRSEIYVRFFPGPGAESQVSVGGGQSPRWRRDGKELYYISPDWKLMAVNVSARGGAFTAGEPQSLFQTHINQATNRQQYDVRPDGRILILTDLPDPSTEPIHLLLNWKPSAR
jgi:serine/threonine protein kinase